MISWPAMDTWLITLLSLGFLALLLLIGHWGERHADRLPRRWIYALALGSCGTSWAFYGTVGQAAATGWWLAPIYLGTIACLVLAWPMLQKMLLISKSQNITSLADFIACRYGRSTALGALITLVTLLGLVPYIALQLRAVSSSFDILTGSLVAHDTTAIKVTVMMALLSILFGTRQVMTSSHNPGLMLVIASSSIVKLLALLLVGGYVTLLAGDDPLLTLWPPDEAWPVAEQQMPASHIVSQVVLGALTIFSLPRLFHLLIIENRRPGDLATARWLLPLYLIAINLFILPIAWVGHQLFAGQGVDPDSYVLTIPLAADQPWIALAAYIGGLAAASGMIIVASTVLSTMLANEILTPLLIGKAWLGRKDQPQLQGLLLTLRRTGIAVILLLALLFHEYSAKDDQLAGLGLLSFVLLVQCVPAMLAGLYWRRAGKWGAIGGILTGTLIWAYTMAAPTLWPEAAWLAHGPLNFAWLKPQALFGFEGLDTISHGLLFSLLFNSLALVLLSLATRRSVSEQVQAEAFRRQGNNGAAAGHHLTLLDLHALLQRFVGAGEAGRLLAGVPPEQHHRKASAAQLQVVQHQLSGVIGGASTRMVLKAARRDQQLPLEEVVGIVDEAQAMLHFNRELLQAAVENIDQGLSVIDADMRLVAWNRRYQELMEFPPELLRVGQPIRKLLQFNADLGLYGSEDPDGHIERRLAHMRRGDPHLHRCQTRAGRVLEIRGQSMPGGGFVTSFSDITDHIQAKEALKQANESLERRVAERTRALSEATHEAESANRNKSRFLAAASHDLMQPFNALSLFTSMLQQQTAGTELQPLAGHIASSLSSAEALLADLLDISKLDAGRQPLQQRPFHLNELLQPLATEFALMAQQQQLAFEFVGSDALVYSDPALLRRVLQNLLSNAVRYTARGKILFGVRRRGDTLSVQIWDTGPGIPADKQQEIFQEFTRLSNDDDRRGLGLGLAICQRIAQLLTLSLTVHSWPGRGTCFAIEVPRTRQQPPTAPRDLEPVTTGFAGTRVLVLDNDPLVQTAMATLLGDWGCDTRVVGDREQLARLDRTEPTWQPQLLLADYHLDHGDNGIAVIGHWQQQRRYCCPCIVNSADHSEELRQKTIEAGFAFLRKPLKTIALKRTMRQLLSHGPSPEPPPSQPRGTSSEKLP